MKPEELKDEIIRLSAARGWTNQELADKSGVPVSTIAAIRSKNNTRVPSAENAMRIMEALRTADSDEEEGSMSEQKDTLTSTEISQALIDTLNAVIKSKTIWSAIFFTAFCLMVLFICAILIYDILHPEIGWITY